MAVQDAGETALAALDHAWAHGHAVLPLDPADDPAVARRTAIALGASTLSGPDGSEELAQGVAVPPGTALVIQTSGSTTQRRGVVLGHEALWASVSASLQRLGCRAGDRWLCVLPLHHVAGVLVALRASALRTAPIVHAKFDVDQFAAETSATHVALVPTMLHRLLQRGVDVARFERILLGGAAASPALLERARSAGARVTTTYGMTETAGGCIYDGVPLDGVAVAIDPDARVLIRGPVLADGYRTGGDIVPLTDDGWLRTSDVGHWDDAGRLVVTGRADDVIITGGVNVSAAAVTKLLRRHPAVQEVAVVGFDDAEWGQRAVAFVVPVDAASPPTIEQLRDFAGSHGEVAGALREVVVVDALPRTALGKLDRTELDRHLGSRRYHRP